MFERQGAQVMAVPAPKTILPAAEDNPLGGYR